MNLEELTPKNIFKVTGDVYFIPVNCVGVMGAGIAKEFKERYPELFERYVKDCKYNVITVGNPVVYDSPINDNQYVIFPTKDNWQNVSQLIWIAQGLENFRTLLGDEIPEDATLVIPPLGCGHGKLDYSQVKGVIKEFAKTVNNPIKLIAPFVVAADA